MFITLVLSADLRKRSMLGRDVEFTIIGDTLILHYDNNDLALNMDNPAMNFTHDDFAVIRQTDDEYETFNIIFLAIDGRVIVRVPRGIINIR
ncbi:unnamed protein product [Acanthocheilonema viteae]|uniref:Uncharacterized protein n=1 Tax=Acanthocheilonema viteae TaxID=6277 RepID=A0A498SV04_ACAVI|nr:unnamed protein product [Acanthocheilonema viteae]